MRYKILQIKDCLGGPASSGTTTRYNDINKALARCIHLNETKRHSGWSGTSICSYYGSSCQAQFEVAEHC